MVSNAFLWTKAETAKNLRISLRTLQSRVQAGMLRAVRQGSRVMFDPADVAKYVEACKTGGGHGIHQ